MYSRPHVLLLIKRACEGPGQVQAIISSGCDGGERPGATSASWPNWLDVSLSSSCEVLRSLMMVWSRRLRCLDVDLPLQVNVTDSALGDHVVLLKNRVI